MDILRKLNLILLITLLLSACGGNSDDNDDDELQFAEREVVVNILDDSILVDNNQLPNQITDSTLNAVIELADGDSIDGVLISEGEDYRLYQIDEDNLGFFVDPFWDIQNPPEEIEVFDSFGDLHEIALFIDDTSFSNNTSFEQVRTDAIITKSFDSFVVPFFDGVEEEIDNNQVYRLNLFLPEGNYAFRAEGDFDTVLFIDGELFDENGEDNNGESIIFGHSGGEITFEVEGVTQNGVSEGGTFTAELVRLDF